MKKVLTLVVLSLYGCSSLVQTNLSEKESRNPYGTYGDGEFIVGGVVVG